MRKIFAACVAALTITAILCGTAAAAPTEVNVRIEGRAETLFEGTVATEPQAVRASSDQLAAGKLRRCDGINVNDPSNTVPGVTPTAVSADAMALIGETFDGQWYKQYEDYFITRWGPDAQNVAADQYWGILVNNVFTSVGGCQYQLDRADEVLWVYDAFDNRPTLALFPEMPHYNSGPRPLVVNNVPPGTPVPVEVVSYADDQEDVPPAAPTRGGSSAYPGAAVAPVETNAKGFERVETSGAGVQTTNSEGKASITYAAGEPGWHRVKATVGLPGSESVIRSNRLDICVTGGNGPPLEGATDCSQLPAADQVRSANPTAGEIEVEHEETASSPPPKSGGGSQPAGAAPVAGALKVSVPTLNRRLAAKGRIGVSWKVTSAGPGVKKWTISSLTVGQKGAHWVTRASGAKKTTATITLPKGHRYKLRFAITDKSGQTTTVSVGKVKVPEERRPHHG